MLETIHYKTEWIIHKYLDDRAYQEAQPFEVSRFDGNLLLNEGITELLNLISGNGTPTAWNNANANLGVGDSNTAEAATQTGLQAATNKLYKAMQATYPQVSAQTVSFQSVFGSADANFAWAEFTVSNTTSDTGKNLNRKVSAQGTKTSGQTWTLTLQITFS